MNKEWEKSLSSGLVHGVPDDENSLYVECKYLYFMHPENMSPALLENPMQDVDSRRTLTLFDIFVPKPQRNQGLARSIVEFLEKRAESEQVHFAIGPIFEDAEDESAHMGDMCVRRNWSRVMPFSYLKT